MIVLRRLRVVLEESKRREGRREINLMLRLIGLLFVLLLLAGGPVRERRAAAENRIFFLGWGRIHAMLHRARAGLRRVPGYVYSARQT